MNPNELEEIKEFIRKGGDVNARNDIGLSMLSRAAWYGLVDCLKLCVEAGGYINTINYHGMSATMITAWHGYVDCLKICIEAGGDVNTRDPLGYSSIIFAAKSENPAVFQVILDSNVELKTIQFTRHLKGQHVIACLKKGLVFVDVPHYHVAHRIQTMMVLMESRTFPREVWKMMACFM